MPGNFRLVELYAQPGLRRGSDRARLRVDLESIFNDIAPPWHVLVDGLTDGIAWDGKSQLQRSCSADRTLWVVWCECHARSFSERSDSMRDGQSPAVGDVRLRD